MQAISEVASYTLLCDATNASTEADKPAFLVGAVIGSACSRHKPKQLGYLQWFYWAENKTKRGAKQKQCPKCGRWYFREEF